MKNFIIMLLLIVCISLVYLILSGSLCHIDYIKPETNHLIPSYLGVI